MFVKTVLSASERFDSAPVKLMRGPMSFVCHEMFTTRDEAGWGSLMLTGHFTSLRRLFAFLKVNVCNGDISPVRRNPHDLPASSPAVEFYGERRDATLLN